MKSLKFSRNSGMTSVDAHLPTVSSDIRITQSLRLFQILGPFLISWLPRSLVIFLKYMLNGGGFFIAKNWPPDRVR